MQLTLKNSKLIASMLLAATLSVSLNSCKKENSSTDSVTEADAAELTTSAVTASTGGFALQVNSSVTVYKTGTQICGTQKDSTITRSSVAGAIPAYNYSLKWNYLLNCSSGQFTAGFTGSSSYNGLRMSSNDNSTGSLVLQAAPSTYTLSTTYNRTGNQTSKIGRNYAFASTLGITSTNMVIDKATLLLMR
ncbi:hypothetical protein BDD43_2116 [Mucilaginibacter gracilis]|uniref:Lipoprotein n=1 Tax=Mucilaginibacter gracilis TaxID=423350 RepID=A0A495J0W6_9SPHI|nr:hypothetical protein [Mucilaginibacter gracilis]RKR81954.1 hypothetical protein BDD43_2116 [Mucilaginibacter gracilis]